MGDKGAANSSSTSVKQYVQRIRQGESAKWDKDALLNVIYWWRQVSGVLLGILIGMFGITGLYGMVMFFVTSISITMFILRNILGIDDEEYGGATEFMFEGMLGSFASFMISWILTHSAMH